MQDYRLPWAMSTHKPRQMLGTMWRMNIWPYYIFPSIRWPGFVIITPSFSPFSAVFSNQKFSNCSSTMDIGFVKCLSDCFCGNDLQDEHEFCCHLLWFTDTILFSVWWSLSLSFGFQQLFLLAGHVLPWFVYVIITLETAALDTPNKVAVFGYRCSN